MRFRSALFLGLFLFATQLFAIDRWILISGTVSNFHTDARLFNPAFDKDIAITATFYATDGSAPQTAAVTVPKRQMKILDDVTTQLFQTSKLGAILFTSNDSFEASSRIYALTPAGTLGQFGPGTPPSLAKTKGALLQLKSTGSNFHTNIGIVNPNNTTANVTWTLYDKNSAIVSSKSSSFGPLSALGPTNMAGGFFFDPKTADLSDAWISFSSDQAILAYASVIDNGTTDQTFIPAVDDAGVPPANPTAKSFDVTERSFLITITPDPSTIKSGDLVVFHIHTVEGDHSFELVGPQGDILIQPTFADPGGATVDKTFTAKGNGTYTYFCTNSICGTGHFAMTGDFVVGTDPGTGRGY
jgi:plastocyanin